MVRAAALNADAYSARLLEQLGAPGLERAPRASDEPAALAWARSGAMALTGARDGEARICPVPLASAADAALALVSAMSPEPMPAGLEGGRLLGERAAIGGLARAGIESCGGACRLLKACDGAFALNLARPADWDLLPAWLESEPLFGWRAVADAVASRPVDELVSRGREIGLALASVDARHATAARWFRVIAEQSSAGVTRRRERPRVVDLSSLWAGPLCSHLLQLGGADVIKLESRSRPDGARQGPRMFFDLLNAGKRSAALDFDQAKGRAQLLALLRDADIVIEASRPRALRQLGIKADLLLRECPQLTWISLTGHGRGEPQEHWIAYGDDAGVDAGLSRVMGEAIGSPVFVGDAIADPLAGLHAAVLALWSWRRGGSRMIDVSLSGVVRHVIEWSAAADGENWRERCERDAALLRERGRGVAAPAARKPQGTARELGVDTEAVLRALSPPAC